MSKNDFYTSGPIVAIIRPYYFPTPHFRKDFRKTRANPPMNIINETCTTSVIYYQAGYITAKICIQSQLPRAGGKNLKFHIGQPIQPHVANTATGPKTVTPKSKAKNRNPLLPRQMVLPFELYLLPKYSGIGYTYPRARK